jgi:hypothetical protein
LKLNFEHYIDDLLVFKRLNCIEIVSLTDQNCIISLCKLLEGCTFHDLADKVPNELNDGQYKFLIKIWFIFWYVLLNTLVIYYQEQLFNHFIIN